MSNEKEQQLYFLSYFLLWEVSHFSLCRIGRENNGCVLYLRLRYSSKRDEPAGSTVSVVTAGFCSFSLLVSGFAQALSELNWFLKQMEAAFLFVWFGFLLVGRVLGVVWLGFFLGYWFSELNWLIERALTVTQRETVPSCEWGHSFQQQKLVQLILPISLNSSLFKFLLIKNK